jgi:hypothetical protein
MATRKNAPAAAEFDDWSDEREAEVLESIAEQTRVKHVITAEKQFYGRFVDGEIIGPIPLKLSLATLEALDEAGEAPVDQMSTLFTLLGMETEAESVRERDLAEVMSLAEKYFGALNKLTNVVVGSGK